MSTYCVPVTLHLALFWPQQPLEAPHPLFAGDEPGACLEQAFSKYAYQSYFPAKLEGAANPLAGLSGLCSAIRRRQGCPVGGLHGEVTVFIAVAC